MQAELVKRKRKEHFQHYPILQNYKLEYFQKHLNFCTCLLTNTVHHFRASFVFLQLKTDNFLIL